eukprot:4653773-Amphidinium_carterae.1
MTAARLNVRLETPTQWHFPSASLNFSIEGLRRIEEAVHRATIRWSLCKGSHGVAAQVDVQPVAKALRRMGPLEAKLARTQFAQGSWCAERLHRYTDADQH